ncbi:hypothetical protein ABFX02_01G050700 [Erythranthe guttata]
MFCPKLHTKFTLHRPSFLAAIFVNSSSVSPPFFHFSPIKNSSILQFSLHSSSTLLQEFTTYIVQQPINASHITSRTRAEFPHAPHSLDEMPHRKYQSSEHTLLRDVFKILQLVMREPSISNAAMVHALAAKQGALGDLYVATSLVTVYSRSKALTSSIALFGEVVDRDIVLWNAMMSACTENRAFRAAIDLFTKMVNQGVGFDPTTLVIVISAFSDLKNLRQGQIIHGMSITAGMLSDTVLSNSLIDMYSKCGDLTSSERMFSSVEFKDIVTWNSIISGCFYNSHPYKSLLYFRHMASLENRADHMSISCAMAACTSLQEFDIGLAIHGWGIKLGYSESSYASVSNSLISFYFQLKDIDAIGSIFNGMGVKNAVSWNTMIKGFFLIGEAEEAFILLRDMQFAALIQPDIATMVTVIPFCAELVLPREGKAAHGFIVRREMASELSVVNCLINMYSKCGDIEKAEYLFSTMPKKDSVAWNTMIFGYAHNGKSLEARVLFKKMTGFCKNCTLPTLLAIVPSCDSPDSIRFGRSIHGWGIKLGFTSQLFALNSLIHMYISCDVPSAAFALFESISIRVDVISWNTIIVGCTQKGHFSEALRYFDSMRKASQIRFNPVTLVSVLSSCGNLGLSFQGKLTHGLALKTGISTHMRVQNSLVTMYGRLGDSESATSAFHLSEDRNLCSWNCAISAMSQNEDARRALDLFRSLDFEPNEITLSTVLSACSHLGAVSVGKQIHAHVFRFRFERNIYISAALIDMYSNCGRLEVAERVFRSSPNKSVSAWNSLIMAYGSHSMGSKAIETFEAMVGLGIRPTGGTFTSLLSACSHAGMVEEGRLYYECMLKEYGVVPCVEHRVCMVDILGRSGRIREAYDFVRELPEGGEEAGVWGPLLSACGYYGEVEIGREVAEVLFGLEPENVSYYVALCNMYVAVGKWEEAVELRSRIQDKQLKKQVGFSFIDVGLR